MANQKITAMPVATSVADADIATIVQGGANKQVTALLLLKTPQDAADAAQAAADAAQSTADDALPKAGGPVTGDIDMDVDAQFVGHAPDGATNPSFTWGGQQALMGMYAVDSDTIGFAVAGVNAAQIDPVGTAITSDQTMLTDEKAAAKYALLGSLGSDLLGTLDTTSGTSQSLTSLDLTGYKSLRFVWNAVSATQSFNAFVGAARVSGASGGGAAVMNGIIDVDLGTGVTGGSLASPGNNFSVYADNSGYSAATTEVGVSTDSGTFDLGEVVVYGVY